MNVLIKNLILDDLQNFNELYSLFNQNEIFLFKQLKKGKWKNGKKITDDTSRKNFGIPIGKKAQPVIIFQATSFLLFVVTLKNSLEHISISSCEIR